MATYRLRAYWLVESFNWNSTHCFKVHSVVFSKFQRVTRSFKELEHYLELQPRVTLWNVKKTAQWALKQFQNTENHTRTRGKRRFIPTHLWRRTNKSKIRKPDEYKSRKQHYGVANTAQMYWKPDDYKSTKQHYGGDNREQQYGKPLTSTNLENMKASLKCFRRPSVDEDDGWASSQTSTMKLRQIGLQEAVVGSIRHANVFTARFLCFSRFPAVPL